jgi:hypothetical protein
MVLKIVEAFVSSFLPTQYIVRIVVGIAVTLTLHAVSLDEPPVSEIYLEETALIKVSTSIFCIAL